MDAKSKAKFINSVVDGSTIICPKCNTGNDAKARFCKFCGTELKNNSVQKQKTDFVSENNVKKVQLDSPEEKSVFAEGLPEWNIEPPQVVVRRKR